MTTERSKEEQEAYYDGWGEGFIWGAVMVLSVIGALLIFLLVFGKI